MWWRRPHDPFPPYSDGLPSPCVACGRVYPIPPLAAYMIENTRLHRATITGTRIATRCAMSQWEVKFGVWGSRPYRRAGGKGMDQSGGYVGSFLTTRQACDRAGFSRPDSFMRSWRRVGFPVFTRRSGRNVVAVEDFAKFIEPEATMAAEHPTR